MNTADRFTFLQLVRDYVARDPESAPLVAEAASAGVSIALNAALHRASDMEIALSAAMARRTKRNDALICAKLKKWEGQTALDWSDALAAITKPEQIGETK